MIIVSDTGPLRYLVEVDAVHALPRLYGDVLTTAQVLDELRLGHFPEKVRRWAGHPPAWLKIEQPAIIEFLDRLDDGEASALSLARERAADLVLIDERAATEVARSIGLRSMGTLAVLQEAGYEGYIDFHAAVRSLTTTTQFRHTDSLIAQIIANYERSVRERPGGQRDRGREP
jgi:predicted nucleic acid-binding protein